MSSRARVPGPWLASAVEGRTVRDMRPVPVSPIVRFGDARADEIGARELQRSRPRMRATPIWVALAFGVTAWVVLAVVVYASWVWL